MHTLTKYWVVDFRKESSRKGISEYTSLHSKGFLFSSLIIKQQAAPPPIWLTTGTLMTKTVADGRSWPK
jgi:hypothetical protein